MLSLSSTQRLAMIVDERRARPGIPRTISGTPTVQIGGEPTAVFSRADDAHVFARHPRDAALADAADLRHVPAGLFNAPASVTAGTPVSRQHFASTDWQGACRAGERSRARRDAALLEPIDIVVRQHVGGAPPALAVRPVRIAAAGVHHQVAVDRAHRAPRARSPRSAGGAAIIPSPS
jgi:hypothetical protein